MVGHGGSSAGSYLADPTSPIPSHCASIVATSTLRVNQCHLLPTLHVHVDYGSWDTTSDMKIYFDTDNQWRHLIERYHRGGQLDILVWILLRQITLVGSFIWVLNGGKWWMISRYQLKSHEIRWNTQDSHVPNAIVITLWPRSIRRCHLAEMITWDHLSSHQSLIIWSSDTVQIKWFVSIWKCSFEKILLVSERRHCKTSSIALIYEKAVTANLISSSHQSSTHLLWKDTPASAVKWSLEMY